MRSRKFLWIPANITSICVAHLASGPLHRQSYADIYPSMNAQPTTGPEHRLAARGCLLLVIAIVVAACGGSGNEAGHGAAVGDQFAARALSVCASALKAKSRWSEFPASDFDPKQPEVRQLPQIGAWLEDQVEPTFDAWLRDLTALGEPSTGQDAWAQVLAAVGRIDNLNKAQIQAAGAGDPGAFADATQALQDAQPDLERATTAAGVGKCAEVHAG